MMRHFDESLSIHPFFQQTKVLNAHDVLHKLLHPHEVINDLVVA